MQIQPILDWFHTLRVTLVLRSGVKYVFHAAKINWKRSADGVSVAEFGWEGAVGAPSFVSVAQIDAIYTKRVLKWGARGTADD